MKVYIHYELIERPLTLSYEITIETIESIIIWFIDAYNRKYNSNLNYLEFELRNVNYEKMLPFNANLADLISQHDDLLIIKCHLRVKSSSVISKSLPVPPLPTAIPVSNITSILKEVKTLFDQKLYKKAKDLCQSTLKSHSYSKNPILLNILSKIYFYNENYDVAVDYGEKSVKALKSTDLALTTFQIGEIRLDYAKCLFKSGQFEEADVEIDRCFDSIGGFNDVVNKLSKGNPLIKLAYEALSLHAECLFETGKVSEAASIVNSSLSLPFAEESPSLLQSYAYFALKYDKYDDAVRALLKVIVLDQNDKRSKSLLGIHICVAKYFFT